MGGATPVRGVVGVRRARNDSEEFPLLNRSVMISGSLSACGFCLRRFGRVTCSKASEIERSCSGTVRGLSSFFLGFPAVCRFCVRPVVGSTFSVLIEGSVFSISISSFAGARASACKGTVGSCGCFVGIFGSAVTGGRDHVSTGVSLVPGVFLFKDITKLITDMTFGTTVAKMSQGTVGGTGISVRREGSVFDDVSIRVLLYRMFSSC